MLARSADTELFDLRKLAESQAATRKERVTSAHLLAAIALREGPAADLLHERGLTGERLLRAARSSTDEIEHPLRRALSNARDVASRMGAREPGATHLLVALLNERKGAAHKALEQCGIDVSRLRIAAMNVGLGLVGRRRIVTRKSELEVKSAGERAPRGVAIPLFPPIPKPKAEALPLPRPTPTPPAPSNLATPTITPVMEEPTPVVAEAPTDAATDALAEPQKSLPRGKKRRLKANTRVRKSTADEGRYQLDPKRQPALSSLGKNLTLAAVRGELDPVIGREAEVEQVLDVLAKRQGNNPCLVGPSGVGKTSVVRALALHIAEQYAGLGEDEQDHELDSRIIVEIPVGELIAGTGVRGALAQRMGQLKKEALEAKGRVVIFFDEVHQLFVGEAAEELSGELKLALARGELPCIGATTQEEYRRSIGADPALARRFSLVEVEEPSREDAFLVLESQARGLEAHHKVTYSEEALALSVGWSVRYMPSQMLPDKAVSIIDLAGARVRRRGGLEVDSEAIAEVVSELADVPLERLLETDRERMLKLEDLLAERVVGHQSQIRRMARIIRRNTAGLSGKRPIGTFLLLGPTGVGKTETAKAIAEVLFYSEKAMTRLDMSEYSEAHAVARLVGAPPGYIGHDAGGQLTEAVRRRPYQVVLLDEVEKAHPEVLETFLQVFDEGRLTDSKGRTVDFTNTVILVTSNLGASAVAAGPKRRVGFGTARNETEAVDAREQAVIGAARAALAPELFNRFDEVLAFRALEREDVREIARRLLMQLGTHLLTERGLKLEMEEEALEVLLDNGGFDPTLGARPMRRSIARLIEAPLAELLLEGALSEGDTLMLLADPESDTAGIRFEVIQRESA
ncbi:MAG: AAA family ATPase [Polyangiaceae bacterium]